MRARNSPSRLRPPRCSRRSPRRWNDVGLCTVMWYPERICRQHTDDREPTMRDQQALTEYLRRRPPLTSVVSYPSRGPWGDNRYPGNCSGYLLIDLCATYRPRRVLDPMEGGGTSRDVCADMDILYAGFDLCDGT